MKWDVAFIDGDRITMGAGFGSEKSIKGKLIHVDPLPFALYKAKLTINKIKRAVDANEYVIFIGDSGHKHFRYKVAKTLPYKGNRKDVKRPEHEAAIREYLVRYHSAKIVRGVEVDDALGIEQWKYLVKSAKTGELLRGTSIICSNDKDLDMIPGWHYDIDYGIERRSGDRTYIMKSYKKSQIYFIKDPGFLALRKNNRNNKNVLIGGGQLWFCAQLLMGDKTDNIPSCPKDAKNGFGLVSTFEVLKDCKTFQEGVGICWGLYKENLKEDPPESIKNRFLEVARLVWIKRKIKKDIIFPIEWLN